jgi:hypothetical protein
VGWEAEGVGLLLRGVTLPHLQIQPLASVFPFEVKEENLNYSVLVSGSEVNCEFENSFLLYMLGRV